MHRCCAGLTCTTCRFTLLSDDNMPFHCPSCAASVQYKELEDLKSAVASLVLEVEQLKSTVNDVKPSLHLESKSKHGPLLCEGRVI